MGMAEILLHICFGVTQGENFKTSLWAVKFNTFSLDAIHFLFTGLGTKNIYFTIQNDQMNEWMCCEWLHN